MPAGVSSCQESLEIKVTIRYEGLKATQYFSKFTQQSDDVFRKDMLALKLPHPKRENTTFISYGCVECVWPLISKNGPLHKQVLTKIKPPHPDERKALGILLRKLSISTLTVKEINPDAGQGRNNLKRPNPFTNEGREEGSSGLSKSEGNVHRVSMPIIKRGPLPPNHMVPKVAEAEAFLQNMSDSFRPHKILKIEPVDVPIPPEPLPRSVQTPRLRPTRSSSAQSSHLSSTSKATNPPESVLSSSSLVSQKPPQAKTVPFFHPNHGLPFPSNLPPAATPITKGKMIMPTTLSDRPAPLKDTLCEPTTLPEPLKEMLRELQPLLSTPHALPEPVQHYSSVPDANTMNITSAPVPQKSFESSIISRPNASDLPRIQRLTRESCDIRRQINADSVRDAGVIWELKKLGAAYIPSPLKVGIADSTMEERIRKLEQDLDTERKLRLEAEDVVRDIRRECKAPFVVPGLLDAFIKLSRLTTQATRLNGTIAKDNERHT